MYLVNKQSAKILLKKNLLLYAVMHSSARLYIFKLKHAKTFKDIIKIKFNNFKINLIKIKN